MPGRYEFHQPAPHPPYCTCVDCNDPDLQLRAKEEAERVRVKTEEAIKKEWETRKGEIEKNLQASVSNQASAPPLPKGVPPSPLAPKAPLSQGTTPTRLRRPPSPANQSALYPPLSARSTPPPPAPAPSAPKVLPKPASPDAVPTTRTNSNVVVFWFLLIVALTVFAISVAFYWESQQNQAALDDANAYLRATEVALAEAETNLSATANDLILVRADLQDERSQWETSNVELISALGIVDKQNEELQVENTQLLATLAELGDLEQRAQYIRVEISGLEKTRARIWDWW